MNISIKNVSDEVAERLRKRAKRHHRSLQGELRFILEKAAALEPRKLTAQEVYERVRAMGLRTNSDSTQIIRELRDAS